MVRHRFRLIDVAAVVAAAGIACYAGFSLDVFTNASGQGSDPHALESDELLAVAAIFLVGMLWATGRLIRERREIARKAAVEREIRQLAFHDPLTGLPNRRKFDAALKIAAGSPPALGSSHALLMLDLNGFKRINDVFGHAAGDDVLIEVGRRISRAVRDPDMVARLGGDEFAVLATHISGVQAATGIALRIIEELRLPVAGAGGEHVIASAIGIALMPQDAGEPNELMRRADVALYSAKAQRESALRFFDAAMDEQVRARDGIERHLRAAVDDRSLSPSYLPIIDMSTGAVRGFEARPPRLRFGPDEVGPESFMPIAEDSGLVGPLSLLLLDQACRVALAWPNEMELAFSLSPMLLRAPGFGLQVLGVLDRTGLAPRRLELGITESALVRELDAAQLVLGPLREAGVRIALDDFGAGYSSLYHLRNFKFDRIRIDSSLIGTMTADRDSAAIVKALLGLGTGLGIEVTAAGVATDGQRLLLAAMGCQQAQGPLYSKPVGAAEATSMVGSVVDARQAG